MFEDFLKKVGEKILADLSALGLVGYCLFVWSEWKAKKQRERLGDTLDKKDDYIQSLTEKTLTMASGYERLTGLLENVIEKIRSLSDQQDD